MPMWGLWWIFPLIGLTIAAVFVIGMVRAMNRGNGFPGMGGHRPDERQELEALRREVRELRDRVPRESTR
jgi:hypothetical protein